MVHRFKKNEKKEGLQESKPIMEAHLNSFLADSTYLKEGELTENMLLLHQTKDSEGNLVNLILEKGKKWISTSLSQEKLLTNYTESRGIHDFHNQQRIAQDIHGTSGYKPPIIAANDALIRPSEDTYINVARLWDIKEVRGSENKYSRTQLTFDDGTIVIIDLGIVAFLKLFRKALEQLDSYRCSLDVFADYSHIDNLLLLELIRENEGHLLDTASPLNAFVLGQIKGIRKEKVTVHYTISFLNKEILKVTIKPVIKGGLLVEKDFPMINF